MPLMGKNYFFSPTGNDANDGSIGRPLKTLNVWSGTDPSKKFSPGDTAYLRGGTYTDHLSVFSLHSGTAAKPIVLMAYNGEKVIISSGDAANTDVIGFAKTALYWVVADLEIIAPTRFGVNLGDASYITLRNLSIHDVNWSGIFTNLAKYCVIDRCTVYNCVAENANHKGATWRCAVNVAGSYNVIKNCLVYHNHGEGIGFYGDYNKAIGNRVHDNWSVNVYMAATMNALFEGNYLYTENDASMYRTYNGVSGPAMGLQLANEIPDGSGSYTRNNVIINNVLEGGKVPFYFWVGFQSYGLVNHTIANNIIKDGIIASIKFDEGAKNLQHTGTKFYNNIVIQTTSAPLVDAKLGLDPNIDVSNNLFWGSAYAANSKYGKNVINADPKFLNTGTAPLIYKVDALNSPCVDAGIDYTTKSAIDFVGLARVQSKIDIGPFETSNPSSAINTPYDDKSLMVSRVDNKLIVNAQRDYTATVSVFTLGGILCYKKEVSIIKGVNQFDVALKNNMPVVVYITNSLNSYKVLKTKVLWFFSNCYFVLCERSIY